MLNVSHVTKQFQKVVANSDISFTIESGRIGILLGPNGAGKSTLIKCVMGFLKYQGTVTVDGLQNKSIEAKRLMGYIPEIPSLYPNLTVEEHMEFIARAYKLTDYKEDKERLLSRFELADKKDKFGDELSKGMQQKLSICCGLLPRPKLVLFDEPMIGLDPHAIKELKLLLHELKADGCSILLSTHMIDSIEGLWDTTYIMKDGKVAAVVNREETENSEKSLEDIFFDITEGEVQTDASESRTDSNPAADSQTNSGVTTDTQKDADAVDSQTGSGVTTDSADARTDSNPSETE